MSTAGAVHARAAWAALAFAIVLSNLHDNGLGVALLSLDNVKAVSFLRALALVSAVAVAALV